MKTYEFEEVDGSTAISIQSEHILDDVVNFLRCGFSKNISDNLFHSGSFNVLISLSIFVEHGFQLVPKFIL